MSIKNNWLFTTTKKTRLDALEQISIIFLIEHTVSSNLLDISEPDHRWRLEEDGSQPYIWQKNDITGNCITFCVFISYLDSFIPFYTCYLFKN